MSDDAKSRAEKAAAEAAAAQAVAQEALKKAERAAAAAAAAEAAEEAAAAAEAAQAKAKAAADAAAAYDDEDAATVAAEPVAADAVEPDAGPADAEPAAVRDPEPEPTPAPVLPTAAATLPAAAAPAPQVVYREPEKPKGNGGLKAVLVILLALLLAVVAIDTLWLTGIVKPPTLPGVVAPPAADAPRTTVYLAPAAVKGDSAFIEGALTGPTDESVAQPAASTSTTVDGDALPEPVAGDTEGLYGVGVQACTRFALQEELAADAAKQAAWIAALNSDPTLNWVSSELTPAELEPYTNQLTGVILVSDTWVTEHGYANGSTTASQVLLQRGSTVFLDRFGVPRVRCASGNPLTVAQPTADTVPSYTGQAWPDLDPATVVSVIPASSALDEFVSRVDAAPSGELVVQKVFMCFYEQPCPFESWTLPEEVPAPAGMVAPSSTACSTYAEAADDRDEPLRRLNGTSEQIVFWLVRSQEEGCVVEYYGDAFPGAVYGSALGARVVGESYVVTTLDGTILDEFIVGDAPGFAVVE